MNDSLYHQRMLQLAEDGDSASRLADADVRVTLDNPLCGDRVTVELRRDADGRVADVTHAVRGCILCRAAAAVVGRQAAGHDAGEIATVRSALRAHLRGEGNLPDDPRWRELETFTPVAPHRSRHECVLLPFDAVLAALDNETRK